MQMPFEKRKVTPAPCPAALARRVGFLFAIYVRERGIEKQLGLYGSAAAARADAEILNLEFRTEATT